MAKESSGSAASRRKMAISVSAARKRRIANEKNIAIPLSRLAKASASIVAAYQSAMAAAAISWRRNGEKRFA
jgi:hypothetical protein